MLVPWTDSGQQPDPDAWPRILRRALYERITATSRPLSAASVFPIAGMLLQPERSPRRRRSCKPGTTRRFRAARADSLRSTEELVATQGVYTSMASWDRSGFRPARAGSLAGPARRNLAARPGLKSRQGFRGNAGLAPGVFRSSPAPACGRRGIRLFRLLQRRADFGGIPSSRMASGPGPQASAQFSVTAQRFHPWRPRAWRGPGADRRILEIALSARRPRIRCGRPAPSRTGRPASPGPASSAIRLKSGRPRPGTRGSRRGQQFIAPVVAQRRDAG